MMEGYNYRLNRFGFVRKCFPDLMISHGLSCYVSGEHRKIMGHPSAFWTNQDLKLEISLNSWVFQKGFFQWHLADLAQISSDCSRQTTTCSASLTHHSGLWWEEMLGNKKQYEYIYIILYYLDMYIYIYTQT